MNEEWIFDNAEEWVIDVSYCDSGWHASMEYITRYYFNLTWEESQIMKQDQETMRPRRYKIALAVAQQAIADLNDEVLDLEYRLRNVKTGEVIPMALFQ